jgi:hypothetical protein
VQAKQTKLTEIVLSFLIHTMEAILHIGCTTNMKRYEYFLTGTPGESGANPRSEGISKPTWNEASAINLTGSFPGARHQI